MYPHFMPAFLFPSAQLLVLNIHFHSLTSQSREQLFIVLHNKRAERTKLNGEHAGLNKKTKPKNHSTHMQIKGSSTHKLRNSFAQDILDGKGVSFKVDSFMEAKPLKGLRNY